MSDNNNNKTDFSSLSDRVTPRPIAPKSNSGIQWMYVSPLLFAPVLPIIRHVMRNNSPRARMFVYLGTVGAALVHGVVLISKAGGDNPKA